MLDVHGVRGAYSVYTLMVNVHERSRAMKIRLLDWEGTTDELAAVPELREALASFGGTKSEPGSEAVIDDEPVFEASGIDSAGELPKDIRDFIKVRAGNVGRAEIAQRWVTEVLGWGTTEAVIGSSKTTSDGLNNYLMLYWKGPRHFGAFAYVMPGIPKVIFRLSAPKAEGFEHVTLRNVKKGTGYEVTVILNSEEAYKEALELARKALSGVQR